MLFHLWLKNNLPQTLPEKKPATRLEKNYEKADKDICMTLEEHKKSGENHRKNACHGKNDASVNNPVNLLLQHMKMLVKMLVQPFLDNAFELNIALLFRYKKSQLNAVRILVTAGAPSFLQKIIRQSPLVIRTRVKIRKNVIIRINPERNIGFLD